MTVYIFVAGFLAVGYLLLQGSTWQGSAQLHTLIESVAALLALMVGAMAMVSFYAKKSNTFLFIGAGFLGAALLDGYHATVSSSYFAAHVPSAPAALIPWSWLASRLFLSAILWVSLVEWTWGENGGSKDKERERRVYLCVGLLVIGSFLLFSLAPLPRAYYPGFLLHRPADLAPAFFFLLALGGYLRQGHWKSNDFHHFLVLSLVIGFISQALFMPFSSRLFDMEFDVAHLLKVVSYGCALTGLLINMFHLFQRQEEQKARLEVEIADRNRAEEVEHLRTREMEALFGIAGILSAPGAFETKSAQALELLARVGQADSVTLRALDAKEKGYRLIAAAGPANRESPPPRLLADEPNLLDLAVERGEPVIANDYQAEARATRYGNSRGIKSLITLPIKFRNLRLGVITASSRETGHFTRERIALLTAIASELGVLLENARLSQELLASVQEMAVVDEVTRIITSTLDIDQVYEKFAREMKKLVDFDRVTVNVVDQESDTYVVKYLWGQVHQRLPGLVAPLQNTQTQQVVATGKTIIRGDLADNPEFCLDLAYLDMGLRSSIMAPLISKGRVIAVLSLRSRQANAYGPRDQAILERLAHQIAPAVENARLYEETRTEKERTGSALAQLQAVVEGVDVGIVLVNESDVVLWANRQFSDFFGIDDIESIKGSRDRTQELREWVDQRLADPDSSGALKASIDRDNNFSGALGEITVVQPAHRILQRFTAPVYDARKEYLGRLWVYYDVTDHRHLEEQFVQAQKMESIGRLAGGVAHDFNNLLTAIIGYCQMSLRECPPDGSLGGYIQEVQAAAKRAAGLTNQLLAFSRRQIIEPKVLSLSDLILNLDRMLRRLLGEDVELVTLPGSNLAPVKVDPGQMEQVLMNLVINARDAMPDGGRIIVNTANVTLSEAFALQHPEVSPGPYVMLSVSDNGPGMSEQVKAHIFEPFFTTKEVGKGTGLGLATCYGIARQSGGYIQVSSTLGAGTTFNLYLPATCEVDAAHPVEDQSHHLPRGTETVLVAEDNPMVRSLTTTVLSDQGYTVLSAANGDEALRMAGEHQSEKIHLLLTDLVMPQMGGMELASRIRALQPETPVLFTSGYTDDPEIRQGAIDAKIEFIRKPFTPLELASKVREVLDR